MRKKKKLWIIIGLFILILSCNGGCLEDFRIEWNDLSITSYDSHPTIVEYNISYGYTINITGQGEYGILYNCFLPNVLLGFTTVDILYQHDQQFIEIGNNTLIQWNIHGENEYKYMLGVQTTIFTETFFTPYLDGRGAATTNEIAKSYPHLVHQYCTKQEKGNITYIDPQNALIKSIVTAIREESDTNNTFLITKEIFKWLKKSTEYSLHSNTSHVQPAYLTCQQKTGDCDDLTFLYISLCKAVGIPSRFISGYLCEESNGSVKTTGHVWAEVFVGGNLGKNGWIPVECAGTSDIQSEMNLNFGVEKSDHIRLFIDNGSNASLSTYLEGPRISYTSSLDIEINSFIKINNYSVIDEKELVVTDYKKRSYQNI